MNSRLEITTKIGCRIMCDACPQKMLITKYNELFPEDETLLSFNNFEKCINKVPNDIRIDWSGFCEPFLNQEAVKMILYAKEKGYKQTLFTTLSGISMDDLVNISKIIFEEIIIHIPDAQNRTSIIVDDNYKELLQNASKLLNITAYHVHGTPNTNIINLLGDYPIWNELHDRAGTVNPNFVYKRYINGSIKCGYTEFDLNHNVLLPNGNIVVCCMDFGLKHIIGNLLIQTWEEIRNNNDLQHIRDLMKSNDDCICNYCYRGNKC